MAVKAEIESIRTQKLLFFLMSFDHLEHFRIWISSEEVGFVFAGNQVDVKYFAIIVTTFNSVAQTHLATLLDELFRTLTLKVGL